MTQTCATCQASNDIGDGRFECRARPPQRVLARLDDNSAAYWPIVQGADWCYDYKDMTLGDYLSSLTGGLL